MSVERFPGLRELPVITQVQTKKIPEIRYSNNLNFPAIGAQIRFNMLLAVGGEVQTGNCQFKTSGLLNQVNEVSEQGIRESTLETAKLELRLPEATRLAKGRKRLSIFVWGKTEEEKQAEKLKRAVTKRHRDERKKGERKVTQQKKQIEKISRKHSITTRQREVFGHMIAIQEFFSSGRKKFKRRQYIAQKQDIKQHAGVLSLPFGPRLKSELERLKSTTELLIPGYPDYVNLVTGYNQSGRHIDGLNDYELSRARLLDRQQREMDEMNDYLARTYIRAGMADRINQEIKFHSKRIGDLSVLRSRVMAASSFLKRKYVTEGLEILYDRLQQARNDLAQQSNANEIAMATSRVKELETRLELAINPLRRLAQDDVPRDIREAVNRVSSRKYDPTRVSETDRVFDDLVLVLIGKKSAPIISPQWQDRSGQRENAA